MAVTGDQLATGSDETPELPDWARWIAQDADGSVWVFEAEPNEGDVAWYENEVGRLQRLGRFSLKGPWQQSLRRLERA